MGPGPALGPLGHGVQRGGGGGGCVTIQAHVTRRRGNLLVHHTKRYLNLVGSNYLGYFAKFSYNLNIVYRIKTVGYLLFYKENTESSTVESLSSRYFILLNKCMGVHCN